MEKKVGVALGGRILPPLTKCCMMMMMMMHVNPLILPLLWTVTGMLKCLPRTFGSIRAHNNVWVIYVSPARFWWHTSKYSHTSKK